MGVFKKTRLKYGLKSDQNGPKMSLKFPKKHEKSGF